MAAEYRLGLMPQKMMRKSGASTSGIVLPSAAAICCKVGFQTCTGRFFARTPMSPNTLPFLDCIEAGSGDNRGVDYASIPGGILLEVRRWLLLHRHTCNARWPASAGGCSGS